MGGQGSGRPPSTETIVAREANFIRNLPSGEPIILPNYSGVKDFARKDRNVSVGAGHTIQDEGVNMNTRTNLNFSGAAVALIDDVGNDATIVSITGGSGDVTSAQFNDLSGAYYTHAGDSSDPHGANLTQTGIISSGVISGAKMVITGDMSVSGSAYVPNIVYNTTSGGLTASNYTIGTLLAVYTA